MSILILNITLKQYQDYGSIVILIIWVYIALSTIRSLIDFKNVSGKTYASLFNPFNSDKLKQEIKENNELRTVYKSYLIKGRKLFFLWIATIILFMIGAAIVANSSAIP